jgi:hypothetical protein
MSLNKSKTFPQCLWTWSTARNVPCLQSPMHSPCINKSFTKEHFLLTSWFVYVYYSEFLRCWGLNPGHTHTHTHAHIFVGGARVWTQGLMFARQAFSQPCFFVMGFFQDKVLCTICPGWPWTLILLIFASWVARITGVSHWSPACLNLHTFVKTHQSVLKRLHFILCRYISIHLNKKQHSGIATAWHWEALGWSSAPKQKQNREKGRGWMS